MPNYEYRLNGGPWLPVPPGYLVNRGLLQIAPPGQDWIRVDDLRCAPARLFQDPNTNHDNDGSGGSGDAGSSSDDSTQEPDGCAGACSTVPCGVWSEVEEHWVSQWRPSPIPIAVASKLKPASSFQKLDNVKDDPKYRKGGHKTFQLIDWQDHSYLNSIGDHELDPELVQMVLTEHNLYGNSLQNLKTKVEQGNWRVGGVPDAVTTTSVTPQADWWGVFSMCPALEGYLNIGRTFTSMITANIFASMGIDCPSVFLTAIPRCVKIDSGVASSWTCNETGKTHDTVMYTHRCKPTTSLSKQKIRNLAQYAKYRLTQLYQQGTLPRCFLALGACSSVLKEALQLMEESLPGFHNNVQVYSVSHPSNVGRTVFMFGPAKALSIYADDERTDPMIRDAILGKDQAQSPLYRVLVEHHRIGCSKVNVSPEQRSASAKKSVASTITKYGPDCYVNWGRQNAIAAKEKFGDDYFVKRGLQSAIAAKEKYGDDCFVKRSLQGAIVAKQKFGDDCFVKWGLQNAIVAKANFGDDCFVKWGLQNAIATKQKYGDDCFHRWGVSTVQETKRRFGEDCFIRWGIETHERCKEVFGENCARDWAVQGAIRVKEDRGDTFYSDAPALAHQMRVMATGKENQESIRQCGATVKKLMKGKVYKVVRNGQCASSAGRTRTKATGFDTADRYFTLNFPKEDIGKYAHIQLVAIDEDKREYRLQTTAAPTDPKHAGKVFTNTQDSLNVFLREDVYEEVKNPWKFFSDAEVKQKRKEKDARRRAAKRKRDAGGPTARKNKARKTSAKQKTPQQAQSSQRKASKKTASVKTLRIPKKSASTHRAVSSQRKTAANKGTPQASSLFKSLRIPKKSAAVQKRPPAVVQKTPERKSKKKIIDLTTPSQESE